MLCFRKRKATQDAAKRILVGRQLHHHLEDNSFIGDMQYGSCPGQQCQSAVLQKVLLHDITRISKILASFIENNAV
jgi:hypothetical protein